MPLVAVKVMSVVFVNVNTSECIYYLTYFILALKFLIQNVNFLLLRRLIMPGFVNNAKHIEAAFLSG